MDSKETSKGGAPQVTGILRVGHSAINMLSARGVIYDKDDLMVNSEPLHARAWTGALANYGKFKYEDVPESIRQRWVGRKETYAAQIMVDEFKLSITAEELLRQKSITFHKLIREEMEAMPGLLDSLDFFKSKGFKIGMATSSNREQIDLVLDKFNIKSYFNVTVCGADVKLGKPDPEIYLLAAKRMELEPRECVVLEDAQSGIKSAKAAGCWCIGVINLNTPPQDRSESDIILNSLKEVTGLGFRDWNAEPGASLRK
jgi:HAD superfamily hydrolase (TIGR01509 family)